MAAQPAPWRRRFLAPQMGVPRWARDEPGRCLYHSDESGRWECHAWDPRTGERRRLTDRPQGTGPGELDPAGDWLWWFDDESGDEFGVWMRQPFGAMPGAATPITLPAAYSAGLALASDRAVVGSTTAAGTAVHVVGHPLDHRLIYSHPEQADLGTLSRDERLLSIAHSEHGDSLHRALRVIDLDGERIADLWDGADRNLTPGPWSPVPGDQRMIVGHDRHDLERPGIWSPTTGEFRDLELPSLGGNVTARWFPDAASLLLVHRHRGRGELLRFHLEAGRLERLPAEPGTIRGAAVRPDGAVWMSWSTAARPPQIRSGGEPLIEPSGAPAPAGVPYQDLRVGSVHGFLAEPPGPRPHPAIFLIHGGPTSQDEDAFSPKAQAWVDHGYAVVHVDYRGSSGYGSAWRDALIGNPGFTELADIHAVRDRLVADGVADPDRLVLSGRSWGGYLTLLGLGVRPDLWSLGIAEVPVADYPAAFDDEMDPLKAYDRDLFGGTPDEIPEAYRQRSPLTYAEQVRVPLHITGGDNDPRCPMRQIENYVARMRALDKPVEFHRYAAGHASRLVEERIQQLELQLAFAARHLGTRTPIGRE